MTDDQADNVIELLAGVKDYLQSINERMGNIEDKIDVLSDRISDFESLKEVGEAFTKSGLFSDSFARQVGEEFNRDVVEILTGIREAVETRLEHISGKADSMVEKIEEVDASIRNIEFPSSD